VNTKKKKGNLQREHTPILILVGILILEQDICCLLTLWLTACTSGADCIWLSPSLIVVEDGVYIHMECQTFSPPVRRSSLVLGIGGYRIQVRSGQSSASSKSSSIRMGRNPGKK
jgi:hypothetical protein